MPPVSIIVEEEEVEVLERFLAERIHEFNATTTGYFDAQIFGAAHRDDSSRVVAGINGYTWGGCCFVSNLWVSATHRRQGLGASLLQAAEEHAAQKKCRLIILSSHSFQAPDFYVRRGYLPKAVIQDYPAGHSDIILTKSLPQNCDETAAPGALHDE